MNSYKFGQTQGATAPFSYLSTTNEKLKTLINSSQDVLGTLDGIISEFCMYEYGKFSSGGFKKYLYTAIVSQLREGQLSGIVPDVPWYLPKFVPPQNTSEWIENKQVEVKQEQQQTEPWKKDIEELKELIRSATVTTVVPTAQSIKNNGAKPSSSSASGKGDDKNA